MIAVSPELFPMSMAAALVSVGNDEGDDADRLRRACVATLCELGMIQLVISCTLKERLNCILRLNFFSFVLNS